MEKITGNDTGMDMIVKMSAAEESDEFDPEDLE